MTKGGHSAIVSTAGNEDCHIILRGGKTPNYDAGKRERRLQRHQQGQAGRAPDGQYKPHANSSKKLKTRSRFAPISAVRLQAGDERIIGVMVESNLVAGRQDLKEGCELTYGQSVTDACIGWEDSLNVLEGLAESRESNGAWRGGVETD